MKIAHVVRNGCVHDFRTCGIKLGESNHSKILACDFVAMYCANVITCLGTMSISDSVYPVSALEYVSALSM